MDTTPAPMVVDSHPTQDTYKLDEDDEMDKKVLAILPRLGVREWYENPSHSNLRSVLQAVIKADPKLNQKWFSAYVDEVPEEVWTSVEEAWRTRSFKRVRILGDLQTPKSGENRIGPERAILEEAMAYPYRGDYAAKFARFCSITQSSGTGKTRLLLELGKELIVLYINLRHKKDRGYPPRDAIPADILTKAKGSKESYADHCRRWFATAFKCLADFCRQNSNRLEALSHIGHETRVKFFSKFQAEFDKLEDKLKMREVMYEYCGQLQDCLKGQNGRSPDAPMMVIALDEAHVLYEEQNDYIPAMVLLQTIKEYSEEYKDGAVWVVFASTMSFPSARVAVGGQQLFPSFTALGWDQHAPVLDEVELDNVSLGSHLLQYGRPLWWSLKNGHSVRRIVDLAGQKLCASPNFNPSDTHQIFAVLGQRFGFDIALGHHHAIQHNNTLVANHLYFRIKPTEDQARSYMTYPSEPIVSVAAAELLHMKEGNLDDALGKVLHMVDDGLIDAGDSEGLASRFLWLLAKDFCIHKGLGEQISLTNNGGYKDEDLSYCRPIPVLEFLKLTFGPEILKTAPEAQEKFKDAFINFSNWISMKFNITQGDGDRNTVTIEEWTESLLARTCAVQCCPNQPVINKVIPVYFTSRPRKDAFSHILISDKACERSREGLMGKITRQHASIAPGYDGPPYIAISVDLGPTDSDITVNDETGTEDPCLRICAVALDTKTFPFLKEDNAGKLRDLYGRQSLPSSRAYLEEAEDEAQFGASRAPCYMNLKRRGSADELPGGKRRKMSG